MSVEGLPERVRYPDGRDEPFTPERITRRLFHAGEVLGIADSFLARELTEGVLHFLALDCDGHPTTPDAIAETVSKVVRELGHPELARVYEERPTPVTAATPVAVRPEWPAWFTPTRSPLDVLQQAASETLTTLSTQTIFPRELVAAHAEGLLQLGDLATPLELSSLVLPPTPDIADALRQARSIAGHTVVLDSPEYTLAEHGLSVPAYLQAIEHAAEVTGLHVQLHVNCADAPPATTLAQGPLFGGNTPALTQLDEVRTALLHAMYSDRVTLAWHMTSHPTPLTTVAVQRTLAGTPIEFIIDRPKRPTILGAGLTRQVPAVLTTVGMDLAHLVAQLGNTHIDAALFLKKVGSLARFAKTAGHVRQDFLRKHGRPEMREGFLLERAALLVVPLGLSVAAHAISETPSTLAVTILHAIAEALHTDRPRMLPHAVDLTTQMAILGEREGYVTPKQQARIAGTLGGCAVLSAPEWTPEEMLDALRTAASHDAHRVRFVG